MTPDELEQRLIEFAVNIIEVSGNLKGSYAGVHLSKQIVRSGTSPALNYGEARGAESKRDFIHKIKIVLKELRETHVALRIIDKSGLVTKDKSKLDLSIRECNELISIFVATTKTSGI